MAEENWLKEAIREQSAFGRLIGYQSWDVTPHDKLLIRIALALYGLMGSSNEPTNISIEIYDEQQRKHVKKLAACIMENQNPKYIYVGFILILGRIDDETTFTQWVFSAPTDASRSKRRFIDNNCRSYEKWEDYLSNNTLPEATICYPRNGVYEKKGVEVYTAVCKTPACNKKNKIIKICDITDSIMTAGSSTIFISSLFFPISAPLLVGTCAVGAVGSLYGMGRGISSLVDKYKHKESINVTDKTACAAWLSVISPVIGLGAGGATIFAKYMSETGGTISHMSKGFIKVANFSNCGVAAFGAGKSVHNFAEKVINKESIEGSDVMNIIASALLFSNALVTANQARLLLEQIKSESKTSWRSRLGNKLAGVRLPDVPVRHLTDFITSEDCFRYVVMPYVYKVADRYGISSKIVNMFFKLYELMKTSLQSLNKGLMTEAEFLVQLSLQAITIWVQIRDDLIDALRKFFNNPSSPHMMFQTSTTEICLDTMTTLQHMEINHAFESAPVSDSNQLMQLASKLAIFRGLGSQEDISQCILFVCSHLERKAQRKQEENSNKLQQAKDKFPNMNENDIKMIIGIEDNVFDEVLKELQQNDDRWIELNGAYTAMKEISCAETHTIGLQSNENLDIHAFSFKMDNSETLGQKYQRVAEQFIKPFPSDCTVYEHTDSLLMKFNGTCPYKMAVVFGVPEGDNNSGLIFLIKK